MTLTWWWWTATWRPATCAATSPARRWCPITTPRTRIPAGFTSCPPDKFAAFCQNLGIGDDTLVVVYDNNQSLYSGRLWWCLNYYGHTNVKVLDGGWRTWVNEGRPISFDRVTPKSGAAFTPQTDESIMVKVDELKEACSLDDAVIWDVRSDGEYTGANDRGNKRAGHVPGAVHLEWFNVMERDSHKFKPAAEIRQMLNDKGITPDKAVFAY